MRKKYLSCIRFLGFCPLFLPMFGLKATETKVIKVTFDAEEYQFGENWEGFIGALYKTLAEHPDYKAAEEANKSKIFGDKIRFDLTVKNGDILRFEPPSIFDCFKVTGDNGEVDEDKSNEVRDRIEKMFSKITYLTVLTKDFSLQSLERFFPEATKVDLWNARKVTGNFERLISNLELTVFRCFRLNDGITWSQFIENICEQLATKNYPDDKRIRFRLEFQKAAIFGTDPEVLDYRDYLDSEKKEPTEITRVLQRIKRLVVDTEQFSMLSLSKVFPWTQELILPQAKYIFGAVDNVGLQLEDSDWNAMTAIFRSAVPHLHTVQAPNVIRIGNAAFFNFRNLRCFNCKALPDAPPTIVCTWLSKDYFTQNKSQKNTRIAPVTVVKGGKKKTEFGGKTVKIGACAFQCCTLLQHVSAHASLVGSGAFAASGLKSAHLLLSEDAEVGDDVFFNCFELKECFMMLGRTDHGTLKSWLNGLFWNCFTLETICMPNVFYPRSYQMSAGPRGLYHLPNTFEENSLTMLANCFSLKHLDLRHFGRTYTKILPYWVIQINHELMAKNKQRWNWKSYRSSAFASKRQVPQNVVLLKTIGNYVKLCNEKEESYPFGFKVPGRCEFLEKDVYAMPCCDINLITCTKPIGSSKLSHFKTDRLCTIIETGDFAYTPGASLFPGTLEDMPSAFQRFNDACLQWFVVKEEKPKNVMTGEKPKNEILGKKVKRSTRFVLHGG